MKRRMPRAGVVFVAAIAAFAAACEDGTPASPTPTLTAGQIAASPAAGLMHVTAFTFAAQGFAASDGGSITYQWDFNDGTKQSGGATVTHAFANPGSYDVWVTAVAASGVTAMARLNRLRVVSLSDFWSLRSDAGLVIMGSTALTQAETSVWGDQTSQNCRYSVTGTLTPPRSITLTWAHLPGDIRAPTDCQALPPYIPWSVTFSGTADEEFGVFTGTMSPGGAAVLTRCGARWEC